MVSDNAPLPILCIYHLVWPILSAVLGIVTGSVLGLLITSVVFLLTFVRTPMHICKMLYVTAVTKECFTGNFSTIMRISVLVLVPLPHLFWLISVTVFSGTVGMLYYIGKCTRIIYNHEYSDTAKKVKSNARLEPKSYLGKYYKRCQEYMKDDAESQSTIYFLKVCSEFCLLFSFRLRWSEFRCCVYRSICTRLRKL